MLYPIACECGISPIDYWEMTYGEITAAIKGFRKREESDLQVKALIAYRQANLIADLVGMMFNNVNHQRPTLSEVFPGFFPEELTKPQQQPWEIMKARVEAYAAEKRKRGENNGNDTGGTSSSDNG